MSIIFASENVPRLPVGTQVQVMPMAGSPYCKVHRQKRRMLTGEMGTIRRLHEDPGYCLVHRYTVKIKGENHNFLFYEVAPDPVLQPC